MLTQRQILTVAAVIECFAGIALIFAPSQAAVVVLGAKPDGAGLMLGRLAGIALAALAICCWEARTDSSAVQSGTVKGITFYNAGAGLFLVFLAASGRACRVVAWSAGGLHLGLAVEFVFLLRGGGTPRGQQSR